jgi:hypothetical protein
MADILYKAVNEEDRVEAHVVAYNGRKGGFVVTAWDTDAGMAYPGGGMIYHGLGAWDRAVTYANTILGSK